jgi:cytochrome b subunit of formate dehydrogenase
MRSGGIRGRVRSGVQVISLLLPALACPPADAAGAPVCSDCHQIDQAAFEAGAHAALACTDCHEGAAAKGHEAAAARRVDCASCHDQEVADWAGSVHGKARNGGATEAPACADCHGPAHAILPASDPRSRVNPQHLPATCGTCHSNPELVAKYHIPMVKPIEAYEASVHARAVGQGKPGATCNDCHGSHAILPSSDPRSSVNHTRIPQTCGRCHQEIAARYAQSVHGTAVAAGVEEAPACSDCHGEHRILGPQEPGSPVYATNVPLQTCGRCHGDVRLEQKFGLSPDKVPAYENSYHGLASRSGVTTVANCASCHGVHDILPSSDPRSHVNPARLAETCGQCHPGAGTRFALGPVHVVATEPRFTAVYYIRYFYLPLIVLTVGGMLLHNGLDLYRKARNGRMAPAGPAPEPGERMMPGFRLAHASMMISFPVLVVTGFALKYPGSAWARPLLRWEPVFRLRGTLHRAAAVLMIAGFVFHLVHLAVNRRARRCIWEMRPRLEDVREFRERIAFYLGRRPGPPPSPPLGYVEKAEYLALIWGTLVMMATGLLLWFDNLTLAYLPKWVADAATAVHFYEAVLATLAILVWHLYWVIFDPVVYPMDTTWLTGRSPAARTRERQAHGPPDGAGDPRSG